MYNATTDTTLTPAMAANSLRKDILNLLNAIERSAVRTNGDNWNNVARLAAVRYDLITVLAEADNTTRLAILASLDNKERRCPARRAIPS